MASIARDDVAAALQILPEPFDGKLEVEWQTDKNPVKLVPCRECARPLVVTTFFSPAKAQCTSCKGETGHVASVGQPIAGSTDPAKAVNLADCLINKHFAQALCPVHPDNDEHIMELKSVTHNDHYGPGEWVSNGKGQREFRQLSPGEVVMHQCGKCNAVVTYSTVQMVQFKRQNEPKAAEDFGLPHRNMLLSIRSIAGEKAAA